MKMSSIMFEALGQVVTFLKSAKKTNIFTIILVIRA